ANLEGITGGALADTFTVGAAGKLTDGLDGGDGGDTLIVADDNLTWTGPAGGAGTVTTLAPAGDVIAFTGIETVLRGTFSPTPTFDGTDAAETITLSDTGTGTDGSFTVSSTTGQTLVLLGAD